MNQRIVVAVLALVLGAIGFALGRCSVKRPSPGYLAALESDNEALRDEVRGLRGPGGPGLAGESGDGAAGILARLRKGGLGTEETLVLLGKLSADQASTLDLDALLGPILETDGYKAVNALGRLELSPSTLDKLDARVIRGAATGSTTQAVLTHYLRFTGRFDWEAARPLLESGLAESTQDTRGAFLLSALELDEGPDEEWVHWAQETYKFSDPVRLLLRKRGDGK